MYFTPITHPTTFQLASAFVGLDQLYAQGVVHGDAAARNIIIPSDRSQSAVWIDFRCQARDVEGELTWEAAMNLAKDDLIYNVFWELVSCKPCQNELDLWCTEHIPLFGSAVVSADDTPEGARLYDLKFAEIDRLMDAEIPLRSIWLDQRGDNASGLEQKIPTRQLVTSRHLAP